MGNYAFQLTTTQLAIFCLAIIIFLTVPTIISFYFTCSCRLITMITLKGRDFVTSFQISGNSDGGLQLTCVLGYFSVVWWSLPENLFNSTRPCLPPDIGQVVGPHGGTFGGKGLPEGWGISPFL